jgi:hypothetical protein
MMRYLAALAVAMVAVFAGTGCNDYGNTFQGNTGVGLAFVSPSDVNAGGPDLTISLTAFGGNSSFVVQTIVTWDQKALKTCVITTTSPNTCAPANDTGIVESVTAVVPAALTANPGTHFVQTVQPHSGAGNNGLSNPLTFIVNAKPNPIPTISSISPNTATAGSAAITLTISGSNFLLTSDPTGGSQVQWSTTALTNLAVANITATQIQATVPATLLANAGSATVTVYNPPVPPPPGCLVNCGNGGGGTSPCPVISACTFTITAAGANTAKANLTSVEAETPAVSADGRYVAYAGSQGSHSQIFARDTCQGASSACQPRTVLISAALDGTAASDDSHAPSMSADGRYVAFSSAATNLTGDSATPVGRQVYLRDTCFGATAACTAATQLVSTDANGSLVGTEAILPSVSASGRYVAFLAVTPSQAKSDTAASSGKFATHAPNSGVRQVFVRDTCLGASNCTPTTTRISLQPGDGSDSSGKPAGPAIGGNGDHIALAGGNTSTLLTRSVAIADDVVLAAIKPDQP